MEDQSAKVRQRCMEYKNRVRRFNKTPPSNSPPETPPEIAAKDFPVFPLQQRYADFVLLPCELPEGGNKSLRLFLVVVPQAIADLRLCFYPLMLQRLCLWENISEHFLEGRLISFLVATTQG